MASSRRTGGRRSQRGSAWLATLGLELISLLAIIGVAQPVWFHSMLQRLSSKASPVAKQTVTQPYDISHPMDAFQPPLLAPARLPTHSSSRSYFEPIDVLRY